jgi:hypothetical protein
MDINLKGIKRIIIDIESMKKLIKFGVLGVGVYAGVITTRAII